MSTKKETCFDCGDKLDSKFMTFARFEPVRICLNCSEQRDIDDENDECENEE